MCRIQSEVFDSSWYCVVFVLLPWCYLGWQWRQPSRPGCFNGGACERNMTASWLCRMYTYRSLISKRSCSHLRKKCGSGGISLTSTRSKWMWTLGHSLHRNSARHKTKQKTKLIMRLNKNRKRLSAKQHVKGESVALAWSRVVHHVVPPAEKREQSKLD